MSRKKTPPTKKDIADTRLRYVMSELAYVPDPTYFFNIGDRVEIGNLKDAVISEVLENGKIYKIDYTDVDHHYGNPIVTPHATQYFHWLDVRPINQTLTSLFKDEDLQLHYQNNDIRSLLSRVYFSGVEMNPEYQRDYVWTQEDKISLIDSIFHHIEIGRFVFVHNGYGMGKIYEILDGKQRINAICEFYENRFPYKGMYYNDLWKGDKNRFDIFPIPCAIIENATKQQILRLFIKLNTSGKVMDKESIDKATKILQESLKKD